MSADKDIVAAVQMALAERIGQHRYELWFGAETQLEYQENSLIIRTPNPFFQDWIAANFRGDLEACCQAVLGFCPNLRFEAATKDSPVLSGRAVSQGRRRTSGQKGGLGASENPKGGLLPLFKEEAQEATSFCLQQKEPDCGAPSREQKNIIHGHRPSASEDLSKSSEVLPESRIAFTPGQTSETVMRSDPIGLPSSLGSCGGRRFADFESFITGPSNQLARSAAEMVVASPGTVSPLVICGPTGVGKTHLLEAICTAVRRRHPRLVTVYLSAEQFTSFYIEALRGSGLPNFRRKYRAVDVLVIDDVQFLAGKRGTQVELLYTIDALQQTGRQLVFAASDPPRELRDLLPDLMVRLDSGVVCRIAPPEYETRLRLVAQYARRIGFQLPEDVCQFVASQFRQHAWELSGAVCRLHAAFCATGEKLTVEFARRVLADMLATRQQVLQLADIRKAVCEVFQIDPAGLCGRGKQRQLSYPRMLAMWLARKYTRAALSEIGQFFGGRSHSTVLSAQKQVDRWLRQGRSLRLSGSLWNPEEAIRQVEKYLRVG
ncbi:MAG: DnaA/Hda family protein [Thermoguttaceae bacterium]|nr:DnaA/Hda family protein [Thermoguttaceae bacterium]MDW8036640.1 DnaA/Hda family protein [Thermoguttaceae bacterium]